jgi:molybdate transport system substrate-binding protein
VFAAASLTESFNDEQKTLKSEQPSLDITYNFGGSGLLVTQIQQGAPADVIATADTASMQKLVDAGLVETPATFAKNKLQILVAAGNPKNIKGLNDLARDDITFVTEDDSVPAGKYAAQALLTADVTVNPVSKETDVKSAVAKVTSGEADATVVYVTDVTAAGSKGTGVTIPDNQNVVATYPIAVLKGAKHHDAAQAFVDAMVKGTGQDALHDRGFLPPT